MKNLIKNKAKTKKNLLFKYTANLNKLDMKMCDKSFDVEY